MIDTIAMIVGFVTIALCTGLIASEIPYPWNVMMGGVAILCVAYAVAVVRLYRMESELEDDR